MKNLWIELREVILIAVAIDRAWIWNLLCSKPNTQSTKPQFHYQKIVEFNFKWAQQF